MIVNGKVALNPYTTDIEYMDLVSIGDLIIANEAGSEFNLTKGKEYKLLDYNGDCILVKDDTGNKEWYTVDYFHSKFRYNGEEISVSWGE